ncbi:MAG: Calx-beta domain-containing protein [Planctomycetota bacterium]
MHRRIRLLACVLMVLSQPLPAAISIQFDPTGDDVIEGAGVEAQATLVLSAAPAQDLTIHLAVDTDTPLVLGTEGADFQLVPRSVVVPMGEDRFTVPIRIIDDDRWEGREHIRITLQAGAGYSISNRISYTLRVEDDDPPVTVSMSVVDDETSEGADDPARVRFSHDGPTDVAIPVHYIMNSLALDRPEAHPGLDIAIGMDAFWPASGMAAWDSIVIPAGWDSVDLVLQAIDDAVVESDEVIGLTLHNLSPYLFDTTGRAVITGCHPRRPHRRTRAGGCGSDGTLERRFRRRLACRRGIHLQHVCLGFQRW